jgi:predicted alpha/beta superfamily hydrolase
MKTILTFLSLFCLATMQAQMDKVTARSRTTQHFANFNSKFVTPRDVDVWLPEDYSETQKYAVLYMHDGQMLFDGTNTWNKQEWQVDEVAGTLMKQDATRKFIVVGISSIAKIRHSDYFPQKPFETLTPQQQDSLYALNRDKETGLFGAKVNSDNYLKFIVTELKPFIDKTFSVKTDQANTFIAGSSMGGLISLYAICEYPKVFGGAACISTHWPGVFNADHNPIPATFMSYLKENLPDPKTHKIYFDYGDQTIDAMYEPFQKQVDEIMESKGYTSENWMTKSFPGMDHSETSWALRLDIPLMFLLGK